MLIICPPHLVPKWKREVEQTVPGVRAAIVESITDLERLRLSIGSGPLFAVMSREKAKLSYRWKAAVIERWAVSKGRLVREEETGEPFRVPCCPDCTAQVVDKDGVPLTDADLNRRKHNCADCGSPLWQADRSGPKRYPLADYVKHHMRGFFDLLIGDEIHEFKSRGSAQGIAAGILADVCGKSLSLTGTLLGGYASTIFHVLYRFSPEIRTEFGRSDEHRWIQRYGFEEITVGKPDDDAVEDGRNSRRRKYRKVTRERPGLVPSALFHIIANTVFLRLSDVASGLPPYEEQILVSSMDSEPDATGYSQRSAYDTLFEELRKELAEALKRGSKRLLATYLQTLLAYPDGCTRGETVFDPRSGDVIVQAPPLSEEKLYPKEKALIDLVPAERMEGRRVHCCPLQIHAQIHGVQAFPDRSFRAFLPRVGSGPGYTPRTSLSVRVFDFIKSGGAAAASAPSFALVLTQGPVLHRKGSGRRLRQWHIKAPGSGVRRGTLRHSPAGCQGERHRLVCPRWHSSSDIRPLWPLRYLRHYPRPVAHPSRGRRAGLGRDRHLRGLACGGPRPRIQPPLRIGSPLRVHRVRWTLRNDVLQSRTPGSSE